MKRRSHPDEHRVSAVVVGSGIGGLLAAHSLVPLCERVTVVERDRYEPEGAQEPSTQRSSTQKSSVSNAAPRRGVPQGKHLHSLTTRGSQLLEESFPGLDAELAAAGAPLVDQTGGVVTDMPVGRLPRFDSGITMRAVSRALLEERIRERVGSDPGVTFLPGHEVTGLDLTGRGRRSALRGVRLRSRESSRGGEVLVEDSEEVTHLPAEIVVDASGQNSRAPRWLREAGYPAPRETVVDAGLGYATRWYRVPEGFKEGWQALAVLPGWPENPRGGVLRRVEGDRFTAVMIGMNGDYPPTDSEGFLEFARSLPTPGIHEAICDLEPLSPVYGFRNTANRRRHYEKLRRMPAGFLVAADAATVMNPSYGQGMTAAALSARALEESLRKHPRDRRKLTRDFHRRQVRAVAPCWTASVSSDRQWASEPGVAPGPVRRAVHRISDEVMTLATRSRNASRTMMEVKNVLKPPAALLRPGILVPALLRSALPKNWSHPPGPKSGRPKNTPRGTPRSTRKAAGEAGA